MNTSNDTKSALAMQPSPQLSSLSSPSRSNEPSIMAKIISGSIGSFMTAFAVTPLEVVKVRQQAFSIPPSRAAPIISSTAYCQECGGSFILNNGLMECILPTKPYLKQIPPNSIATATLPSSMPWYRLLRHIFKTEGLSGLYAGLAPTLIMSVPNTVLYFTTYDELSTKLHAWQQQRRQAQEATTIKEQSSNNRQVSKSWWIPLVSGSSARLLASLVTAPLEYIRTRQALNQHHSLWAEISSPSDISRLYRGLVPTLWRDVPFSAIYWFSIEFLKTNLWENNKRMLTENKPSGFVLAGQSFVNGALSGMVAAACTAPFDVIKTRQQQQQHSSSIPSKNKNNKIGQSLVVPKTTTPTTSLSSSCFQQVRTLSSCHLHRPNTQTRLVVSLQRPASTTTTTAMLKTPTTTYEWIKHILRHEGIRGLWTGNTTRMIKVAPACAIMITCYEVGKHYIS